MSRISTTQLLLDNADLQERGKKLQEDYDELYRVSNMLLDDLNEEIGRLEELCHANGVTI